MTVDIRDKAFITEEDVMALNFIGLSDRYRLRRHYRQGLRSHIMEVLDAGDVDREISGEMVGNVRHFPAAKPLLMLRILRNRFRTKDDVLSEIRRYTTSLQWLGKDFIAWSQEFVVDYRVAGKRNVLLCGLQEYVDGEVLDPWNLPIPGYLNGLLGTFPVDREARELMLKKVEDESGRFVGKLKRMISETGYIPDLAGIGNLMITAQGTLKLVDINNIMKIPMSGGIPIDDRGYPACDKSVEVLLLLESRVLKRQGLEEEPFYRMFLAPERKKEVARLEEAFYQDLATNPNPGKFQENNETGPR